MHVSTTHTSPHHAPPPLCSMQNPPSHRTHCSEAPDPPQISHAWCECTMQTHSHHSQRVVCLNFVAFGAALLSFCTFHGALHALNSAVPIFRSFILHTGDLITSSLVINKQTNSKQAFPCTATDSFRWAHIEAFHPTLEDVSDTSAVQLGNVSSALLHLPVQMASPKTNNNESSKPLSPSISDSN